MPKLAKYLFAVIVTLGGIASAHAQGLTETKGKRIGITPYVWAESLTGNGTLGPVTGDVDVPFSDLLKKLNFGAMVDAEYWNGRWGFLANINYTALEDSRSGVIGAVSTEIKQAMIGAAVSHRFGPFGSPDRPTVVDPYVGLRYTKLDTTLNLAGGVVTRNRTIDYIDPIIGARVISKIGDRIHLIAGGDIGGFGVGSDFTWQAYGMLALENRHNSNGAFIFGYRALGQDISKGGTLPIAIDVVYHGPVLGYTFKF